MDPTQVLDRVLADHADLRRILDRLESRVRAVLAGRRSGEELRAAFALLDTRFRDHLAFEDEVLVAALGASDGWSDARVARVREDHARQRQLLDESREHANRQGNLRVFALASWGLVQLLREDMDEEERVSVNAGVLRDDLIDPSMETD